MSEDEPLTRREALELRDAIQTTASQLMAEFRSFRVENADTYVRKDTHQLDLRLQTEAHNKDVQLLNQTITANKEAADIAIKAVATDVEKINSDGDWLKKLVYGFIVTGILTLLGFSGAASAGLIHFGGGG